jgi:hypothetical protein
MLSTLVHTKAARATASRPTEGRLRVGDVTALMPNPALQPTAASALRLQRRGRALARYKSVDESLRFVAVNPAAQILPGSFRACADLLIDQDVAQQQRHIHEDFLAH